jgi:hypothetical protein
MRAKKTKRGTEEEILKKLCSIWIAATRRRFNAGNMLPAMKATS